MERFPSPEEPERYKINTAQEEALRDVCGRYGVAYSADDYRINSPNASMMASYALGWVGGDEYVEKTIYVGVDPDGRVNS